eukprot:GHVQ01011964.1.p1 GENE.GHVQ01011964.1~~GHVQ01011964.1.p1  ORF type:complete len:235 (+),score=51.95 GHVQ01011964.1:449-1153(+)
MVSGDSVTALSGEGEGGVMESKFRARLPPRPYIEDREGLKRMVREIEYTPPPSCKRVPWIETLSLLAHTVPPTPVKQPGGGGPFELSERKRLNKEKQREARKAARRLLYTNVPEDEEEENGVEGGEGEGGGKTVLLSDIARETMFVDSVDKSVQEGLRRLKGLSVPFTRPDDFLAEMLKSDKAMLRVKNHIASQLSKIGTVEKRRKLQFDRKFKKQSRNAVKAAGGGKKSRSRK